MAAGDLTTLATAKMAAGQDGTTAAATDLILGSLITAISAYVPNAIGRQILADNYSEIYDGNGKQELLLRQRPIIQISSIAWPGQSITTAGDELAGAAGFWTDGRAAYLSGYCFPRGARVRIIYSAGYLSPPADLSLAVAELVAEAYGRRSHVGETSRSQGGQTTISFDPRDMHKAIASKLKNYMIGAPC